MTNHNLCGLCHERETAEHIDEEVCMECYQLATAGRTMAIESLLVNYKGWGTPPTAEWLRRQTFQHVEVGPNNWKAYIPDMLRNNWSDLSDDALIAAFIVADEQAENEHWD